MLPVVIAFCSFFILLSILLFIKKLKRDYIERQRLARASTLPLHMPAAPYNLTNPVILTNAPALGNPSSAIILRHPPMDNPKPFYEDPPPPYDALSSTTRSPQPSAPPAYDELPGSIPSSSVAQTQEPLSRLQPNVLPQKR